MVLQNRAQNESLVSEGSNLQHSEKEGHLNSELDIQESIKLTELSFNEWIKKHVLLSTVSGEVNYLNFFSENQYVEIGEKLISVIPKYEPDDYFGILNMPIVNSGKVMPGQSVHIKLSGYPESQYGVILGSIHEISQIPNEDYYLVRVNLNNGLKTTFSKELSFKQNIEGTAEIITEDLRLIERFLYTLTKAFK
jgi:hypothetical protein